MTKRPYILIVEDDQWQAEQHVRVLEAAGYRAEVAPFGAAAMDVIDQRVPDVLLVDVLLPGGTIFTLLHELRSHVDLASIPVIICTNSAEQLAEEDLLLYGVTGVLDKASMLPEDVVVLVKKALP
jgi:CheY-like chemotaxis protein